jgi:hypothetical protein
VKIANHAGKVKKKQPEPAKGNAAWRMPQREPQSGIFLFSLKQIPVLCVL